MRIKEWFSWHVNYLPGSVFWKLWDLGFGNLSFKGIFLGFKGFIKWVFFLKELNYIRNFNFYQITFIIKSSFKMIYNF